LSVLGKVGEREKVTYSIFTNRPPKAILAPHRGMVRRVKA
jgi:hypothetical protein